MKKSKWGNGNIIAKAILILLWVVTGTITLISGDITRLPFFCVWFCLILHLVVEFLEEVFSD